MKYKTVNLIGDGRYDSPDNNATFRTYTLMNSEKDQILDFFIAHVKNAGNSQRMEAYAFRNVLDMSIDVGVIISAITTGISKFKKSSEKIIQKYYINSTCGTSQKISTRIYVVKLS